MKKKLQRIFSLVLALSLTVSILSVTAFAADGDEEPIEPDTHSIALTVKYGDYAAEADNAVVTLTAEGSEDVLDTQTCNADGEVTFSDLADGTYTMEATYQNDTWGIGPLTNSKTVTVSGSDLSETLVVTTESRSLVKFFLRKEALVADTAGNVTGRPAGAYTTTLWTSAIDNASAVGIAADETVSGENNYAYEANSQIHECAGSIIENFPSDEQIFAFMIANGYADGLRVVGANGNKIALDSSNLDTDHYAIRWYVLKTSNSWHVDGILVAKSASLAISKTFYGLEAEDAEAAAQSIQFTIASGCRTFSVLSSAPTIAADGDGYTYTWQTDVPWGLTYTVTENNFDTLDGESCQSQYAVAANAAGTLGTEGTSTQITVTSQDVDQGDGANTVVFSNTYAGATGDLAVTKHFAGLTPDSFEAAFEVRNASNAVVATKNYSDFTDGSYTFEGLPVGTYSVVETGASGVDGYTLATTYSADSVSVTKNETAKLTVTNTYSPIPSTDTDAPGGDTTTPSTPSDTVTDIPNGDTPLTGTPETELPETDTPLADAPAVEETTEIPDEDAPLADAPKTGDSGIAVISGICAAASLAGLVYVTLTSKKKETV